MIDLREPPPPRRAEPVLPMVNLVFLLLVFFLMVATIPPPAPVTVEPPRADLAAESGRPELVLHLDRDGIPHAAGVTGAAALVALRDVAGGAPVTLRADRAAPGRALAATVAALAPSPVTLVVEPGR